ncbi:uncharacterized protein METZ01_LOCUS221542 [marine metagenome]|uniref:Uncharacterized protein n=1 Tax=marine metagenome TaxID=408172 RepID=A0A382G061_9ZZZZ
MYCFSSFSNSNFRSSLVLPFPKPVKLPLAPITLWQGIIKVILLFAIA